MHCYRFLHWRGFHLRHTCQYIRSIECVSHFLPNIHKLGTIIVILTECIDIFCHKLPNALIFPKSL